MPCFRKARALAAAALLTTCTARAQANLAQLQSTLVGKTFFLRPLCAGENLHFSSEGKPTDPCLAESFTVGLLTIDRVEESSSELKLTTHRVGLAFQDNVPRQVDLSHPRRGRKPHEVVLHVAIPSSTDFTQALDAVLTSSYEALLLSIPEPWQAFFHAYLLGSTNAPATKNPSPSGRQVEPGAARPEDAEAEQITPLVHEVGTAESASKADKDDSFPYPWAASVTAKAGKDGVAPPKVIRQRESSYSPQAKSMLYTGKSVIRLIVNEHGVPQHLVVRSPAGLGLDEEALAAIAQYRFEPATKDGSPAVVQMNIQTSFQIY